MKTQTSLAAEQIQLRQWGARAGTASIVYIDRDLQGGVKLNASG